jgi:hypothetical protein
VLRNSAGGKVYQYGISATPYFWPFPHFQLKARALFAELAGDRAGAVIADANIQHRLRRTICKGWRNKAWHGRLMAFSNCSRATRPVSQCRSLTLAPLRSTPGRCPSRRWSEPSCCTTWKTTRRNPTIRPGHV